jgi:crotonobetainyl-CoA:carnitine CoA-transferase CaiB-like acyl-CoA transferase
VSQEALSGQDGNGPLTGIRVVELATVLMAPFAVQILGDMGADVIKVEGEKIDTGRLLGSGPHPEISGVAMNSLRNKRSIQVDLRDSRGRDVLLSILETGDVFVTNMRPGALHRLGLDYGTLAERFPRLIYCEAHGFRSDSPDAERPAFDDVIQGETGMPRLLEYLRLPASFLPSVFADKTSGLYVAIAVLGAIVDRIRTGHGQRVEVPMFDAVLAFNLTEHLGHAAIPGNPPGYKRILSRHRGPHRTADGYIAMIPYSDRNWRDIFVKAGCAAEFEEDPRLSNIKVRHQDPDFVYGRLAEIIATRTTQEWTEFCVASGIPFGQVPSISEIVEDPALHRGVLEDATHPVLGPYRQIRPPIIYDSSPMTVRTAAPFVGQHSEELLRELNYDDNQIRGLLDQGIVRQAGLASVERGKEEPE